MNPISMFFSLASRQADIRRAFAIWSSIKPQVTELIDLVRSIGADVGLLTAQPRAVSDVPDTLKTYDATWIQRSLNTLMNAGLVVDGDLGNDSSKTRQAIKNFQTKHGLKADGWPGVQTLAVMAQEMDKLNV